MKGWGGSKVILSTLEEMSSANRLYLRNTYSAERTVVLVPSEFGAGDIKTTFTIVTYSKLVALPKTRILKGLAKFRFQVTSEPLPSARLVQPRMSVETHCVIPACEFAAKRLGSGYDSPESVFGLDWIRLRRVLGAFEGHHTRPFPLRRRDPEV